MKIVAISFSFLLALLSGCASQPVKVSEASDVPNDRILSRPRTSSSKPAQLIVVRDGGAAAPTVAVTLKVDGRDVAKMFNGERVAFLLDAGTHTLAIYDWVNNNRETSVTLQPSEKAHFRILLGQGFGIRRWEELAK